MPWNAPCKRLAGLLLSQQQHMAPNQCDIGQAHYFYGHTSGDEFSHAERRKAIETVIPTLPFSTLESVTREISKACVSQRSLPVPKPNCHQLLEVALEFWLIGFNRIESSQFVALAYRLSVRIEGNVLPLSSLATAD